MRRALIVFFASGAGLGYAPVASGTVGTLYGVALHPLFEALRALSPVVYVLTFVALVAAAVWIAGEAETIFADHDSGRITIDEAAGYMATALFLPFTLRNVIVAFLVFRLFDILKPWPASWFDEHGRGGPGVVLDDFFSGLYGCAAIRIAYWLLGIPA